MNRKLFNTIPLLIAIVAVCLTFFTEKFFMDANPDKFGYFSSKVLYFVYVYFIFRFLLKLLWEIKQKNEFHIRWMKNFLIILIPFLIYLAVAWPGYFVWDEYWVYTCATQCKLDNWQSYLTVYFYIINLYIFPSIGMIVFVQIIFMASVSSWFITKLHMIFRVKWANYILLFILIVSPAIVVNTLLTYRSTMVAILEVWVCGLLYFSARDKKISNGSLVLLAFLTVLLSSWRQEAIYHIVLVPLFLFFFMKSLTKKTLLAFLVLVILGFFTINNLYNIISQQQSVTMKYQLTAYMNPISNILADKNANVDDRALNAFDKVINVKKTKDMAYYYETPSFWNGAVREGFTQQQFNLFKSEFWRVVFQNKDIYLSSRFRTMIASSGLSPNGKYPTDTVSTFFQNGQKATNGGITFTLKKHINQPISLNIRQLAVDYLNKSYFYLGIYWDFIPLLIILIIILVRSFSLKNPLTWVLILSLARVPLLYLLEPGSYFMYYYPMVLSGIFLLVVFILERIEIKFLKDEMNG